MVDEVDDEPVPTRKRGRPRVAAPLSAVSTRLTPEEHDKLTKIAHQKDISVADVMRESLRQGILRR